MKVSNNPLLKDLANIEKSNKKLIGEKDVSSKNPKTSSADLKSASNVELSDRAMSLQKAKEIARNESVDEVKVDRLQRLIDSGQYNVDASAIADKLVDEHLLMS